MAETIQIPMTRGDRRALAAAADLCDASAEAFARAAITSAVLNMRFDVPAEEKKKWAATSTPGSKRGGRTAGTRSSRSSR